jgi:hypothetical protein
MAAAFEWSDDRVLETAADDVVAFLPAVVEEAFGSRFVAVEPGRWRSVIHRAGKRFVVDVSAEPRNGDTAVRLLVQGDRSPLAKLGTPILAITTACLWIAAATLFVLNWRRPSAGLWPAAMLLVPTALTVLAVRLMRVARLDAMVVLADAERFNRALDRLSTRLRNRDDRKAERVATELPDEGTLEAVSEAEDRVVPHRRA